MSLRSGSGHQCGSRKAVLGRRQIETRGGSKRSSKKYKRDICEVEMAKRKRCGVRGAWRGVAGANLF